MYCLPAASEQLRHAEHLEQRATGDSQLPHGSLTMMRRYPVALPGRQQGWRWGFHSCNGLSAGADLRAWREPHLWEDVMAIHEERPLNAMCGGGDQIYNDALWQEPSMQAWVSGIGTEVW